MRGDGSEAEDEDNDDPAAASDAVVSEQKGGACEEDCWGCPLLPVGVDEEEEVANGKLVVVVAVIVVGVDDDDDDSFGWISAKRSDMVSDDKKADVALEKDEEVDVDNCFTSAIGCCCCSGGGDDNGGCWCSSTFWLRRKKGGKRNRRNGDVHNPRAGFNRKANVTVVVCVKQTNNIRDRVHSSDRRVAPKVDENRCRFVPDVVVVVVIVVVCFILVSSAVQR